MGTPLVGRVGEGGWGEERAGQDDTCHSLAVLHPRWFWKHERCFLAFALCKKSV
jgi:hypothetical protein